MFSYVIGRLHSFIVMFSFIIGRLHSLIVMFSFVKGRLHSLIVMFSFVKGRLHSFVDDYFVLFQGMTQLFGQTPLLANAPLIVLLEITSQDTPIQVMDLYSKVIDL